MLTPQQRALWVNEITRECLIEAGDDVDAGMIAAEYIIETQPEPREFTFSIDVHGREHAPAGTSRGGQFVKESTDKTTSGKLKSTVSSIMENWGKHIGKAADKVKDVAKFIRKKTPEILSKIPGASLLVRKAKELSDNLRSRYGIKGMLAIVAGGIAITYRKHLYPYIASIANVISSVPGATTGCIIGAVIGGVIGAVKGGPRGAVKGAALGATVGLGVGITARPVYQAIYWGMKGGGSAATAAGASPGVVTGASAVATTSAGIGSVIGTILIPPVTTMLALLAAFEIYRTSKWLLTSRKKYLEEEKQKLSKEEKREESTKFMIELDKISKTPKSDKSTPLSVDAYGREHIDKGRPGAGQFVSTRPGRSKHERIDKSPFTFASPHSEEKQRELDDLINEVDAIKVRNTGPIRNSILKISDWVRMIGNKVTQIISKMTRKSKALSLTGEDEVSVATVEEITRQVIRNMMVGDRI